MNEGAPKTGPQEGILDMEEGADGVWRMEKEEAPEKVDELVESIEGFEQMSGVEKISTLKTLLSGITEKDKYMQEPLANQIKALEVTEEYIEKMVGLGREPGSIIDKRV
jgi:hypothetical protein